MPELSSGKSLTCTGNVGVHSKGLQGQYGGPTERTGKGVFLGIIWRISDGFEAATSETREVRL